MRFQTWEERQFWEAVYAARIRLGSTADCAASDADRAITHLRVRM